MDLKAFKHFNRYKNQIILIFPTYIGISLFGFIMVWTVPVIVLLQDPDETPLPEVIDDITASWIGSLVYLGYVIGPYVANIASTKYGRIPSMRIGCIVCTITFTIQSFFTDNVTIVYIQRLLQGFGISFVNMNTYTYIGEVASAEIRGSLMGLVPLFQVFGTMLLIVLAPVLSFKGVGYLGLSISLLSFLVSCLLPESPLWLAMNGKKDASDKMMARLNRADKLTIDDKSQSKSPWKEIYQSKSNRKALFIIMPLVILEVASGVSTLLFFTTSIYEMANITIDSNKATIISSGISSVIVILSSTVVDKAGRRILMLISTFGTFISMAFLGTYFYLDTVNYSDIDKLRWMPLVCVILFTMFFIFGFGTIPLTLVSEMFNNNLRTLGPAITMTPASLVGFISTTAYGYMITSVGMHFTFWIHSIINAAAFVFTLAFLPETKGKTLAEIQVLLNK